ncbi:MAG: DUF47 family protein [Candidatus Lokiarchaeota archaeon]|nr:DUF47 family protein [Candidatus Lokiarchaeota archaeon]
MMSIEFSDQISKAENRVLDDLLDYLRGMAGSTRKLNDILNYWFEGKAEEIEKTLKELIEMETSSNELKYHLLNEISGQVLNLRRGDFMRLILSMANIVDEIGGTGYRIKFLSDWKSDEKIQLPLKRINEKIIQLVNTLKDIIFQLSKNTVEAMKKVNLVSEGEREIDAIRRDLMNYIYSIDIEYKTFIKIRDLINHYESIADHCEIASDLCRIIAVARRGSI